MKTIALITTAAALGLAAAGCTQDADIGMDSTPITCMQGAAGEAHGTITTPSGYQHAFGATAPVQASLTLDTNGTSNATVELADNELLLFLAFQCGQAQLASYDLVGLDQQQQLVCPFQVAGSITGQINATLGATDGIVIIDQNANCLAGRFRADFGDAGVVTGWFSTPWQ